MLEFLDTTLQWSKINFNRLQINRIPINSEIIIKTVLEIYKDSYLEKNISVRNNLNSTLPLFSDPEIFSILFRNVFSNAIKFTPQGGTITVSNEMRDGRYVLSVENSGKGISAEKMEMIRSRNYQSERGTMGEKGLGLGLKLCQQLLDIIGARLEIEGNSSHTLFKIVL